MLNKFFKIFALAIALGIFIVANNVVLADEIDPDPLPITPTMSVSMPSNPDSMTIPKGSVATVATIRVGTDIVHWDDPIPTPPHFAVTGLCPVLSRFPKIFVPVWLAPVENDIFSFKAEMWVNLDGLKFSVHDLEVILNQELKDAGWGISVRVETQGPYDASLFIEARGKTPLPKGQDSGFTFRAFDIVFFFAPPSGGTLEMNFVDASVNDGQEASTQSAQIEIESSLPLISIFTQGSSPLASRDPEMRSVFVELDTRGRPVCAAEFQLSLEPQCGNPLPLEIFEILDVSSLASGWKVGWREVTWGGFGAADASGPEPTIECQVPKKVLVISIRARDLVGSAPLVKIDYSYRMQGRFARVDYSFQKAEINGGPSESALGGCLAETQNSHDFFELRYGDVTGDGTVSALDAQYVLGYLVGFYGFSELQMLLADVTGSGTVSPLDAAYILKRVVGLIEKFPAEEWCGAPAMTAREEEELLAEIYEQYPWIEKKIREYLNVPQKSALLQNYPNPFNPETWIPFELAESADSVITVYDTNGHLVRTIDLGYLTAGLYSAKAKAAYWDGTNATGERVASGMYLYHIQAGKFSATRRMVILK